MPLFTRWLGGAGKPALIQSSESHPSEPEDAEAQFQLGRSLGEGEDTSRDYGRAAGYYLKAAAQGHLEAQFNLGLMFGQGKGVLRNEASALVWLRKAAEQGHPGAQYHLGVNLYRASKHAALSEASQERIEAYKYVQRALTRGYRAAESALEFMALGMTRQEVEEGGRRAVSFSDVPPKAFDGAPNSNSLE
jgi:TPR repeat protein